MSQLTVIKAYVADLDDDEFAIFRDWFVEFERLRLEADPNGSKLGALISEVLAENQAVASMSPEARDR